MRYSNFDELPDDLKIWIAELLPKTHTEWVHSKIPALHNQSPIDVMNSGDVGELFLRQILREIQDKF